MYEVYWQLQGNILWIGKELVDGERLEKQRHTLPNDRV